MENNANKQQGGAGKQGGATFTRAYLQAAHSDACTANWEQIQRSTLCGCAYCGGIYEASLVRWEDTIADREGPTAVCPKCGIDCILGDASGYPVTPEFLEAMYQMWFT